MTTDQSLRSRLQTTFKSLNLRAAVHSFPSPGTLADTLDKAFGSSNEGSTPVSVEPQVADCFVTAAIEIWHRGVHSFLISASLTDASPVWASVSGYYSSHYSIRALAHLLGHFHLFRRRRVVRLELQGGQLLCTFDRKGAKSREHQFYWNIVSQDKNFGSDPLFTSSSATDDASGVRHRGWANYADHISKFPNFRVPDKEALLNRVRHISQISFTAPPTPRLDKFPDIEAVQVVAYQRFVRFRQFVDETVGGSGRFWKVHRTPSWAREMIDFQLIEQSGLPSQCASI